MSLSDEALVESIAGALRPTRDRGDTALVVGATGERRNALANAVTNALSRDGRDGPLVVRVNVHGGAVEFAERGSLVETVSEAVERELTRVHAPGGLYEDRGEGLLPWLGGWIFRARTAGYLGLCLVIDDVDVWCDARGRATADARVELKALVEASRWRSLSVLATCRAGAARGSPALPGAVLEGFAMVHLLGGVTTVARDPSTLVAALGGRAFSLPGLKSAIEGWLELPVPAKGATVEDTVIVFNAPLAPPLVPAVVVPAVVVPAVVTDGAKKEVEVTAKAAGARGILKSPTTAVDREKWAPAVRAAVRLQDIVLRSETTPLASGDAEAVVELFMGYTSRLPLVMESLARSLPAVGVSMPSVMGASVRALSRVDAAWRASRKSWEGDDESALHERVAREAEAVGARVTAVVLFSGLRVDLWPRFSRCVKQALPGLRGGSKGVWRGVARGDAERETERTEGLTVRRESGRAGESLRVGVFTKFLEGTEVGGLEPAVEKVEAVLPELWRSIVRGVGSAGGVVLLAAGDEGVGEVIEGSGGSGGKTRRSGDGSVFAEVLPWGVFSYGVEGT